jgi:hypothetical protein
MTDAEIFTQMKPTEDVTEKEVEVTEKEFKENYGRRCYTKVTYFKSHGRLLKRTRTICYKTRHMETNNLNESELSNADYLKEMLSSPEVEITQLSKNE